jgi:hypothetical protein
MKNRATTYARLSALIVSTKKSRRYYTDDRKRKGLMSENLPAPCEHCKATGMFRGSECHECGGKGYRLMINRAPSTPKPEREGSGRPRRERM